MKPQKKIMSKAERLREIAEIIERVDQRCMAADGPVQKTLHEMDHSELRRIYLLATGSKK
jgi:hypothetical protein